MGHGPRFSWQWIRCELSIQPGHVATKRETKSELETHMKYDTFGSFVWQTFRNCTTTMQIAVVCVEWCMSPTTPPYDKCRESEMRTQKKKINPLPAPLFDTRASYRFSLTSQSIYWRLHQSDWCGVESVCLRLEIWAPIHVRASQQKHFGGAKKKIHICVKNCSWALVSGNFLGVRLLTKYVVQFQTKNKCVGDIKQIYK